MKIENIIRRILREDTAKQYYSALRRVMFDDDDIKLHLREFVLKRQTYKKVADDEFIEDASNHVAYQVLKPGLFLILISDFLTPLSISSSLAILFKDVIICFLFI
jgi:hypothetical protein